jgi:hypothetical protein
LGSSLKLKLSASSLSSHRFSNNILAKRGETSINVKCRIGDKQCLLTVNTGTPLTTARPDIIAVLPKIKTSWPYIPRIVPRESG